MRQRYGFTILSENNLVRIGMRSKDYWRDASMMMDNYPDVNEKKYCKKCGLEMQWFILVSSSTKFDSKSGIYDPLCEIINVCPKSNRNPHASLWVREIATRSWDHDHDFGGYSKRNDLIKHYGEEVVSKLSKAKQSFWKKIIKALLERRERLKQNAERKNV